MASCFHNVQLYSAIAASRTRTNLFLLHRKNLSPERRIAALRRRLLLQSQLTHVADPVRNFVSEGDDLQTILAKDADGLPQSMKNELLELRRLVEFQEKHAAAIDEAVWKRAMSVFVRMEELNTSAIQRKSCFDISWQTRIR